MALCLYVCVSADGSWWEICAGVQLVFFVYTSIYFWVYISVPPFQETMSRDFPFKKSKLYFLYYQGLAERWFMRKPEAQISWHWPFKEYKRLRRKRQGLFAVYLEYADRHKIKPFSTFFGPKPKKNSDPKSLSETWPNRKNNDLTLLSL
jgi:hypothetical protein